MKIFIPTQSKQTLGGGFTWRRTFTKYAQKQGVDIVQRMEDADAVLISGATMVERDYVQNIKNAGKKIVFRIDNIPRNSRNRNTGTSRLYDFAQMADLVIYQSQWAKDYIMPFVKHDGPVILNGADEEMFNPDGEKVEREGYPQYLYVQYNRDETKEWHRAWYDYIMVHRERPEAHLWIIGNFSPEQVEYKFDFFMGERFRYLGIMNNPEDLARYYRSASFLKLPYFNDACSNTLIEYLLCNPAGVVQHNFTGGNKEIMGAAMDEPWKLRASSMTAEYINEIKKTL